MLRIDIFVGSNAQSEVTMNKFDEEGGGEIRVIDLFGNRIQLHHIQ